MVANPDDMIIRGIKGEIYPCKPDIFKASYDAAEESPYAAYKPHEQRVFEERNELSVKIAKLLKFTHTERFDDLPVEDRRLLRMQRLQMEALEATLGQRIERFVPNEK